MTTFRVIAEHEDSYKRTVEIDGTRYQAQITIFRQSPTPRISLTADTLNANGNSSTVRLEAPVSELRAWQDCLVAVVGIKLEDEGPSTPAAAAPTDADEGDNQDLADQHMAQDRQLEISSEDNALAERDLDGEQAWQDDETRQLRELWEERSEESLQSIAHALGRPSDEVMEHLQELGLLADEHADDQAADIDVDDRIDVDDHGQADSDFDDLEPSEEGPATTRSLQ